MTAATDTAPDDARTDQDFPLTRVPAARRKGVASVAVVIAGFGFFTPTMVTGGQVAGAFGLGPFLGLALAAAGVLAVYIAAMGLASARTGLTTVLLARLVLGRIGGKWASILLGGTQIGWYGITIGVLATLLGQAFGTQTRWPIVLIGGVVMAITAYKGFRGMELLSWIAVPLMTALCLWIAVAAVDHAGGWSALFAVDGTGGTSVGVALTLMIGTFISGGTQVGNWTRFAAGGWTGFSATAVTILLVQGAMFFFGGLGAIAYGQPDFAEVLMLIGSAAVAALLIVANLWTTNDNAAYAFGVAGSELFGKADKRPFVVGGVVIGVLLALTGIADALSAFLTALGVLVPPLGGAIIGTFLFRWKAHDPGTDLDSVPPVRLPGLVAYLAGTAVAIAGAALGIGIPALQGVAVALVLAAIPTKES
ncbi:cytosine permease [Saccharopolyspora flava]|uniref:Cytosine permease n=1 Tax=Saccharopolyspora flava TaxID=95161 RepID=A0A1I6SPG8_9PSEU|nr:cytosine permease [Saccharopolyspora flava]SFS78842.1 cytosine permease [Saccharopolyspora flava]